MKKLFLMSGIIGFISILGCNNDKEKEPGSGENSMEQVPALPENTISNTEPAAINAQPVPVEPQINQTPPAPSAVPVAAGMNPAHGQPGHRCDIAVGAPLNSPPGNTAPSTPAVINAQPSTPAPGITMPAASPGQTQTIQAKPPAGPTPPGMNPPHGEPGHDCGIPVGSPLKK